MCPLLPSQPLQEGAGEELHRVHPCGQELCLLHRRGEPPRLGLLGQPELPHTPAPALTSFILSTRSAKPQTRWVWERGQGQKCQQEITRDWAGQGLAITCPESICFWPAVQGAALQHPGGASGRRLPGREHIGHGEQP